MFINGYLSPLCLEHCVFAFSYVRYSLRELGSANPQVKVDRLTPASGGQNEQDLSAPRECHRAQNLGRPVCTNPADVHKIAAQTSHGFGREKLPEMQGLHQCSSIYIHVECV